MTNLERAVEAIRKIDNHEDLWELANEWQRRQNYLNRLVRRELVAGDTVEFDSKGSGIVRGKIKKINKKTATVTVQAAYGPVEYRVAMGLLSKVLEQSA